MWRPALLALSLGFTACVVSPQPSPPEKEPDLDGGGIGLVDEGVEDLANVITFEAAPGTVDPAEGVVIATNLDETDAPSTVAVRPDGSFSISLAGLPGETIRFQVDQDGNRSQPVDIAVDATNQVVSRVDDAPSCFVIDPARYAPLPSGESARSLVLKNGCNQTVEIAAPHLRRGKGPFTFSPTQSLSIDPGGVAFVTVRASGTAEEIEDVLFLDLVSPLPSRRAITLTIPE